MLHPESKRPVAIPRHNEDLKRRTFEDATTLNGRPLELDEARPPGAA